MPLPERSPLAELTPLAIGLGLVLAVVMAAANVYAGLKVGMTVSAAIPASVIAMALLQGVLRRKSILEANLVQTAASSGESLAAGIIFTMPALVIAGVWKEFNLWTTTFIGLAGGLLGTLLMIPMRRVFVVGSPELKFPEGVACAEVLKTGQREEGPHGGTGAALVFQGLAVGAVFKLCASTATRLLRDEIEWGGWLGRRHAGYYSLSVSPLLLAVGVIVGLPVAVQIFMGGALGWVVTVMYGSAPAETYNGATALAAAKSVWVGQTRFFGVGCMLVGGVASLWRVRGSLGTALREMAIAIHSVGRETSDSGERDERQRDLSGRTILVLSGLCVAIICSVYYQLLGGAIGITLLATEAMLVLAFLLTAIASYTVGLVGSSNSPVSGMTIMALLATGGLIWLFGYSGPAAVLATLGVAGVACCAACTSGDICNDLKTGHLVGASPRRQQIVQVLSVVVAAVAIPPVLNLLHVGSLAAGTGGIGGKDLSAPQAKLFATLADGLFGDGQIPWPMVAAGMSLGLLLLALDKLLELSDSPFRLYVMPVAVGIYLPLGLATPILIGGVLHALLSRRTSPPAAQRAPAPVERGILLASGVIAGESLMGVGLALAAVLLPSDPNATPWWTSPQWLAAAALAAVTGWLWWTARRE